MGVCILECEECLVQRKASTGFITNLRSILSDVTIMVYIYFCAFCQNITVKLGASVATGNHGPVAETHRATYDTLTPDPCPVLLTDARAELPACCSMPYISRGRLQKICF